MPHAATVSQARLHVDLFSALQCWKPDRKSPFMSWQPARDHGGHAAFAQVLGMTTERQGSLRFARVGNRDRQIDVEARECPDTVESRRLFLRSCRNRSCQIPVMVDVVGLLEQPILHRALTRATRRQFFAADHNRFVLGAMSRKVAHGVHTTRRSPVAGTVNEILEFFGRHSTSDF